MLARVVTPHVEPVEAISCPACVGAVVVAVPPLAIERGKVKEVCDIIKPKIGIVTGVNEQHLALFGTLNNLLLAEGGVELAGSLPKDGVLFVNGDNKYCLNLYKKTELKKEIYDLNETILDLQK